jgi:hypothetical protein
VLSALDALMEPAQVLFILATYCGWPCESTLPPDTIMPAPDGGTGTDGSGVNDGGSGGDRPYVKLRGVALNQDFTPKIGVVNRRYCALGLPAINAQGTVAFHAVVLDPSAGSASMGLFTYDATKKGTLAYSTPTALPGTSTFPSELCAPYINDSGDLAFRAARLIDGTLRGGAWTRTGSTIAAMTVGGSSAAGLDPSETLGVEELSGFTNAGAALIAGDVKGTNVTESNDRGLWSFGAGMLGKIYRDGDGSKTLSGLQAALGSDGSTVAIFSEGSIPALDRYVGASVARIASAASPLPGTADGKLIDFNGFAVAGATIAYAATFSTSGASDCGLWSGPAASPTLQLLSTSFNPGLPPGAALACPASVTDTSFAQECFLFWDLPNPLVCPYTPPVPPAGKSYPRGPVINTNGEMAVVVPLSDSSSALIRLAGGTLTTVAQTGAQAVDCPSGTLYAGFAPGSGSAAAPAINALGQIAFYAQLTGSGVIAGENDLGIFLTDATSGQPRLLVRTGDMFPFIPEVQPSEMRKVIGLEFATGSGGADGRRSGLNANGELVFHATFASPVGAMAGGDGHYVASLK